jgi:hypothetical protein
MVIKKGRISLNRADLPYVKNNKTNDYYREDCHSLGNLFFAFQETECGLWQNSNIQENDTVDLTFIECHEGSEPRRIFGINFTIEQLQNLIQEANTALRFLESHGT